MNTKRVRFAETASVLAYEVEGTLKAATYRCPSAAKLPAVCETLPVSRPKGLLNQNSIKSALRAPSAVRAPNEDTKRALFYLP